MSASGPTGLKETTLVIRHLPDSNPASFQVSRLFDQKTSQPVAVKPPVGFPVEGRPNSDLMTELQWYLEKFLDYPFPPETDHADRVLNALRDWGEQAFQALFGERPAARFFDAATSTDFSNLHLQISSDDPQILSWPWEALHDPELGFLAHNCQIERRLNKLRDPQPLPQSLSKDRVNILLVVARPFENDVGFRSIARPLMELIEKEKLPASVELLRPPTFDQLRQRLREKKGFYHLVHFDGHGAYFHEDPAGGHTFQGAEGMLAFETEDGKDDLVPAEKLSTLLKECAVPGVVLNACQSAMISGEGKDPFASVAMALLRSGMRDVVAMAYSLYVSGAQKFLPEFYRRLFAEGSMAVAVRAGRQQMFQHDKRVCVRGEFPLQDWLLPVLYRQDPLNFSFAKEAGKATQRVSKLPEDLRREKNPYGFVGRDSAILALERALRRKPTGILIQGLGGVGKTTLARGFLQWLDQTGGLNHPPFWFGFQEIRSTEFVFNRLGEALFGTNFSAMPGKTPEDAMQKKIQALAATLRENRLLIVWDNFESAAGIAGTSISANLPESDRNLLGQFLDELRGGGTKVIITSRSSEDWLGPQRRFLLPLGGLDREERWEYCDAILNDLGRSINRDDQDLVKLMDLLGGHPLAMRVILPQLERMTAGDVLSALRSNLAGLNLDGDPEQARLYATLAFVEQSLPEDMRPLLTPLGMHEGYVDAYYFQEMAEQVDSGWTRPKIDALMQALVTAGLLRDIGHTTYEMHPLLTSYLRSAQADNRDGWARAFVDVMGHVADKLATLELHQQRLPFRLHGQNFYYALAEAERLKMQNHVAACTQSLAAFAQNNRNLAAAQRLFERLAAHHKATGEPMLEAAAYHQLGMLAAEQRDFAIAEQCYGKALAIKELHDDEPSAAITYHQLGMIAQEQRDFAAAEQWYRKSLAIEEKHGNEPGAASSYGQMGRLAQEQRDFAAAEQWYRKALAVSERLGHEHHSALSYHQLGRVAQIQQDYATAGHWYRKSLAITEKQGNEHHAAMTYHQLGTVAQEQRDFANAEQWYRKSLAIKEKQRNEHAAASTYGQLGILAGQQGNLVESGQWLIKCLLAFLHTQDQPSSARTVGNFLRIYRQAPPRDQEKLEAMWQEAGFGELPEDSQP